MRQNPDLTRSDATGSTLRPKCPQSQSMKPKQGSAFVEFTETPFLGNLATAAALGQVSESATTRQVFRKIEYAAGMPQTFCRQPGSKPTIGPAGALQWVSPQRARRLASSIGGLAYGGTDRVIFGTLSHEQIGRTRAYVITKWRQSEIQQVKETKVTPPRTHGKVGDPVGGQCNAVR
jgi:hypothetical protein